MSNTVFIDLDESCPAPLWFDKVEPFVFSVLEKIEVKNWELSILFCTDPFIAALNKQYRNIDGPTDVLSFEQGDEYIDDSGITHFSAGDIVISIDSLMANAQAFDETPNEELKRLLIHGILHLKGLDHGDDHIDRSEQPSSEMLQMQERILLGFKDYKII